MRENKTALSVAHQLAPVLVLMLSGLLPLNTLSAEELSGTTAWVNQVELSMPVGGVIAQVKAAVGQKIKQGQVLLILDQRPFAYRIQGLQAKVDKLKELDEEMQAELKRAKELYQQTLLSDHELELAKIDALSADADYRLARSALSSAQLNREYSSLRAPFDALVLQRHAEKGQVVSSQLIPPVLFVLASSQKMKVLAELDGREILHIKRGQTVKVLLGEDIFQGHISALGLEPATETGSYFVEVEFKTSGKLIRAGQKAKLLL
ncbi:MAG TPA: efflux RND transporter periplasmic adaptor subunit [Gammaproteobacteria bacterium]|nr:efflux RND transporter periplasmic adaptor subunit [Gammaproteobacteria bacterium]